MVRRARLTREDHESRVARLSRFYRGERTLVFTGDEPTAHEIDPRTFFLESMNEFAPEVQIDLRSSVLPNLLDALGDRDVMALTWDELSSPQFAALRTSLESWAARWGLEPQRWTRDPTWMPNAALRLMLKWREGQSTTEFTLTYSVYTMSERTSRQVQELRSVAGFPLLVFGHVLQLRPWLSKAPVHETTEAATQLMGDREPQDIAKTIRRTAALIGLKSTRKAQPGR